MFLSLIEYRPLVDGSAVLGRQFIAQKGQLSTAGAQPGNAVTSMQHSADIVPDARLTPAQAGDAILRRGH
jgi:hypothetical protein